MFEPSNMGLLIGLELLTATIHIQDMLPMLAIYVTVFDIFKIFSTRHKFAPKSCLSDVDTQECHSTLVRKTYTLCDIMQK